MNGRRTQGDHDSDTEVVALSPYSLMNSNRYVCEVCNKGFQRDQNLQLHKRGHQLPWKLKKRSQTDNKKKVYLCPVPSCAHHYPGRALGDITGIKKHFLRKHCEKKYKCLKCIKCYAVKSDWTAHMKNCGSNSYTCDCGMVFGRKDTYRSHKAFCEALAAESLRVSASHPRLETSSTSSEDESAIETMNHFQGNNNNMLLPSQSFTSMLQTPSPPRFPFSNYQTGTSSGLAQTGNNNATSFSDGFQIMNINPVVTNQLAIKDEPNNPDIFHASQFAAQVVPPQVAIGSNNSYTMSLPASVRNYQPEPVSATTLLQRVNMIRGTGDMMGSTMSQFQMGGGSLPPVDYYNLMGGNEYTARDFLSLSVGCGGEDLGGNGGINSNVMMDYGVSLGGTTNNMNLIGNWGCGGNGMNVNSEGSEWVPRMTNLETDNVHQIYGFPGGPSTSQGWNLQERK